MIRLPRFFSSGAVLQRRKPLPFWGWTDPESIVEVKVGEFAPKRTKSSLGTGKFQLHLPPVEAPGPYSLTVTNLKSGESISLENIYFGEVFLCSGQSNMEFRMESSPVQLEEAMAENTPEKSEYIRFFNVERNGIGVGQDDCIGSWQDSSNSNLASCSAVAYQFARKLYQDLNVPVGLLHSAWGGTRIEAWISRKTLRKLPLTAVNARELDYTFNAAPAWENKNLEHSNTARVNMDQYFRENCVADPGNLGYSQGFAANFLDDQSWKSIEVPGDWIRNGVGGHGACWFRKRILVPAHWAGKDLSLNLCIADKQDITYFNGEEIARSGKDFEYAGEKRKYTIPGKLVKEGENLIAVRVYSFAFGAGFYGSPQSCFISLPGEEKSRDIIPLGGAWKAKMEQEVKSPVSIANAASSNCAGNPQTYGGLFDGMIKPLAPCGIAGVLWYQGETNAGSVEQCRDYETLLTAFAEDLRDAFENEELAFFVVSLAGYHDFTEYLPVSSWAVLRESQRRASRKLDHFYIAAAHDVGEELDIHPQDKYTVGVRLALQALYHLYGRKELTPSGPDFLMAKREGEKLRLSFDFSKGLHTKDGRDIGGFYIAGTSRIYYKAEVTVEGEELLLSSPEVKDPAFVRYAWSDFPDTNLVNEAGLPVHPFEV